jgi:cytochrome subunit of sulfide dehydrogenase
MKLPFLIPAMLLAASASAMAQSPDAPQVRGWAASCSNCHGTQGRAQDGMDKLGGADRETTLTKLLDFKNGRRPASIMHQLSKGYSDEQLAAIAAWFAAQKP